MMKIVFRIIFIFKKVADEIGKISMFSYCHENWYLGLFWSEKLIGNDENCIRGHFYDATVSKMAANKIVKLSMVSDFNVHWYLGVSLQSWKLKDQLETYIYNSTKFHEMRIIIIIIIIITRLDCVWMQTQKSPNDPHIGFRAFGCTLHLYHPIPHFKILLDINVH
jgi:hypothetical protein